MYAVLGTRNYQTVLIIINLNLLISFLSLSSGVQRDRPPAALGHGHRHLPALQHQRLRHLAHSPQPHEQEREILILDYWMDLRSFRYGSWINGWIKDPSEMDLRSIFRSFISISIYSESWSTGSERGSPGSRSPATSPSSPRRTLLTRWELLTISRKAMVFGQYVIKFTC